MADEHRLALFAQACQSLVRPGDIVADVGCGTGVLGLLSLKAGAGHVYEIDDGSIINVARKTFAQAGLLDQATFIKARVQHTRLPEQVDVAICDHVGYFGFDYGILDLFQYTKQHFLKPGGKLIPGLLKIEIAAVGSEKLQQLMSGWQAPGMPEEYHWLADHDMNTMHGTDISNKDVLSDADTLAEIDLLADHGDYFSWQTRLTFKEDGNFNGFGAWFRSELAPGIWMTNSPLMPDAIKRSQVFLPIGNVPVKEGDTMKVTVMTRPSDNIIAWDAELPDGSTPSFSTWQGMMLDPADVAQLQLDHVPVLNALGKARAVVLGYCDGVRTLSQIQQLVCTNHPGLFPTEAEILRFVVAVARRDTN
ncbi:MAG: class I SAM-dependent methyltransferase [Rhizobiales bacterium]|nr:class I SAM-dependent methyltransferase [Hyphomicrobiales bacterium]